MGNYKGHALSSKSSENVKEIPLAGRRKVARARSNDVQPFVDTSSDYNCGDRCNRDWPSKREYGRQIGGSFSYDAILIRAVASALQHHPILISSPKKETAKIRPEVNLGLAISLQDCIIVPVIRNAYIKSLIEINREVNDLIIRAGQNRLAPLALHATTPICLVS